ncbi:cysteine desulfurase sulfur acceptor subunit CsdE [Ewingella americana]|jgi:cysteine desulfuration protein SufE|uniref:Cysteine desulfurase sulfur acceptor subunit CsdE n=1 Tax=Ewingella americana TaxID=41202 RepID=A0A502GF35_9GAMM|nr:cysteine desulfurase sulfur acceptor subunit CsdE [Ewingella americana]TPG60719.1 cysteine desulfurase sulfur acceptor subunit CsdE [Ewingella americana]
MLAPHPFGHDITEQSLVERFSGLRQWEDRYRQLILLAKNVPALDDSLKTPQTELSGCENRVWLGAERLDNGAMHFYGDSEGRIVKGLLAVVLTKVEGKTPQAILEEDPLALFDTLGLREQLSTSRASGLTALAEGVLQLARRAL